MMIEALDGTIETIAISEGIQAEAAKALELSEVDVFENKLFFSEVDEDRIEKTADIMSEVFSKDVLANWSEFSLQEKADKLNEYYIRAGECLGIETKGVIIEPIPCDTPGMVNFGYNARDGFIHLNEEVVDDPTCLGQVLETATHEMRHQFQSDVLANPAKFGDVPQNVLNQWAYEMDPRNYINPDYDYQGYYEQAVECDARGYAENVMSAFGNKLFSH